MRLLLALSLVVVSAAVGGEPVDLFNGIDLSGWEGDDRFWSVEDGAIVGRTTPDNPADSNTFLIHRGGTFDDFVLTFEYQVTGFNSGIQYRSKEVGEHSVAGYQADFEARWHDDNTADKFSGMFFEEQGRMFLAQRGQSVLIEAGEDAKKPKITVLGSLGDAAEMGTAIDRDGWNRYRIVADGHSFQHFINDRLMAAAIDEDDAARADSGLIALQLHGGRPMEIRVRKLQLTPLHD